MIILICASLIRFGQASASDRLTQMLDSYAAKHFNGLMYVERDGKELYSHSVGFADPDSKRPFTPETGIEIGSIVKPFSKTVLLRLAEQGKLNLDDSIAKYFPDCPEDKKPITIHKLMEHRSGFQDVFGPDYEPMQRDELMKKMLQSKLLFKPGAEEQYSNSGYSMLATIEEKITGESFEKVVNRLVFQPIGLKRTGYVLPRWKSNQLMVGYRMDGSRWGTPLDHFWFKDGPSWNLRGNGGMFTTVKELARWCRAVHGGELFGPSSYKLFSPGLDDPHLGPNAFWAAAGGNGIFDTIIGYNPSRRLVIVLASTDARFQIETVDRALSKIAFDLVDKA